MLEKPYYFRPESYLYLLQSHPEYYFCVGHSDVIQALWGLVGQKVYIIWFTRSGDLKEIQSFDRSDVPVPTDDELDHNAEWDKSCEYIRQKFGLADQALTIKRFWLQNINVGIEDVTDNLKECLLYPASFNPEEIVDCEESLEIWKAEQQFVFWWEQSFYVNSNGIIETS